jgi:CPA1 family monovalent cation:H+ antiporter
MSERTREHLDTFWELLDEVLNAVLFVLIGLEVLVITFDADRLLAGLIAIPLVLLARLISVGFPIGLLRRVHRFSPGAVRILTWGGLRGGISVALALSLPPGEARDLFVPVTYLVVVFSILVQGLTIGRVVRSAGAAGPSTQR